jgi:solute carrier family 35 protein E3
VTDVNVRLLGVVVAAVSVVSSGTQQVLCGTIQRTHKLQSHQLLANTAPLQGGMLLLVGPLVDKAVSGAWVGRFALTPAAGACLLLSCVVSVGVNISQFMCLGRFSAVTFQVRCCLRGWCRGRGGEVWGTHARLAGQQTHSSTNMDTQPPVHAHASQVLGHTKTILVLLISCLALHEPMPPRKLLGMVLAVTGMVLYGYFNSLVSGRGSSSGGGSRASGGGGGGAPETKPLLPVVSSGSGSSSPEKGR